MKTDIEQSPRVEHQTTQVRVGDTIANGITTGLVNTLSKLCVWFHVTPESVMKQKTGVRGNTPPPSGGISSY